MSSFKMRKEVEIEVFGEIEKLKDFILENVETGDLIGLPDDCMLKIKENDKGVKSAFMGDNEINEFIDLNELNLTQHRRYFLVLMEHKTEIMERIDKMNENAATFGERLLKSS